MEDEARQSLASGPIVFYLLLQCGSRSKRANNSLVPVMDLCETTSSSVTGRYFSTLRGRASQVSRDPT